LSSNKMIIFTHDAYTIMKEFVVILCGGVGERLWPYSTRDLPKQFQSFFDDKTLLDLTIERLKKLSESIEIVLVSNELYREHLTNKYLINNTETIKYHVLCEPSSRNTSASILMASVYISSICEERSIVSVLPSDHYFDSDFFSEFLRNAIDNLDLNTVTTFGITPTKADTGFGYIMHKDCCITRFVEKPSIEVAEQLIADSALWNAGIFLFETNFLLDLYEKLHPLNLQLIKQYLSTQDATHFNSLDNISFDHAVMEKINCGRVLKYESVDSDKSIWNDVGDWNRMSNIISSDPHTSIETVDLFIKSDRPVIALGVKDLILISSDKGILVSTREHLDLLKKALSML
jgi:mannose-1-phosphate guanylyltransferase